MLHQAAGYLRCRSDILLILILSIVAGTASGSALVDDRCAAGSLSPCGARMHCTSFSATSSTPFAAAASNTAGAVRNSLDALLFTKIGSAG